MAKSKDTTASAAKTGAKTGTSTDSDKARNLVRLLNTLALLLAITAFLLQFFAVLTHAWKYQVTNVRPLLDRTNAYAPDDSRIDQSYGLFSRNVKVYSNNDEQLDVDASTRFPRVDNGDEEFNRCLSQTSSLRGSLLTCNYGLNSPDTCHCRRYPHWNAVIFFEIAALVLLGLVVVLVALFTTQYRQLLKLAAAALAFLAFLCLLIGLIILIGYLKRETRSIADSYPYVHSRLGTQVGRRHQSVLHKAIRREAHETYRAYSLSAGQHPYNQTHYQQYSEQQNGWVYLPYTSLGAAAYAPRSQTATQRTLSATRASQNAYGPLIHYEDVYANTHARIGWSTVLSILATILSLLLPLLLAYSWLTGKKIGPDVKTVTTTTVRTEYAPVPQEVTVETVPLNRPTTTETHYTGHHQQPQHQQHQQQYQQPIGVRDDHSGTTTQTYRT